MHVWNKCITIILSLFLCGCASVPDNTQPITPVIVTRSNKCVAICVGVENGQAGYCAGAKKDAVDCYEYLTKRDFAGTLLVDADATWEKSENAVLDIADKHDLKRDDLLALTISSHGSQTPDLNNDEDDGMDEVIHFYDQGVVDDAIKLMFVKLAQKHPGIRVWILADTCHSEGNFRRYVRKAQSVVTFGHYGKRRGKPMFTKQEIEMLDIQIMEFAGCRENAYSLGSVSGGNLTQTQLAEPTAGKSWKTWFDGMAEKVTGQEPVYVEYNIKEEYRNGQALR